MPHHDVHPAPPAAFPLEAAQYLLGFLRGQQTDWVCAVHCALALAWHAWGAMAPDTHEAAGQDHPVCFSPPPEGDVRADLEQRLQAAVYAHESGTMKASGEDEKGFDWTALLPLIVTLIQQLLQRR